VAKTKSGPKTRKKLGGQRLPDGGPREDKARAVAEIAERLGSSTVILTEYRGLTVGELAELRRTLAGGGAEYKVVKNTLATIAARRAGTEGIVSMLEGPTAAAFVSGDVAVVAKLLAEFAKRAPALVIKGGLFEGRVLDASTARRLATLESREVMLAKLAGMLVTPVQQAANLFAAPLSKLGAALAQLKEKNAAGQAA
jgi:large subunit ribosomal protein L10